MSDDQLLNAAEARLAFPHADLRRGDSRMKGAPAYFLRPCPVDPGQQHLWTERKNAMGAYRKTQVGLCGSCHERAVSRRREAVARRVARWREKHPDARREQDAKATRAYRARKAEEVPAKTS
jgi:cytochrome c553